MRTKQALDLIGDLTPPQVREVFDAARPIAGTDLRPGIYLGRVGGMPWLSKGLVRHLARRDYFAKLIVDGWGLNVRVRQDGSHALQRSERVADGVCVDYPFRLTSRGLEYGYHVAGRDWAPRRGCVQLVDELRSIEFGTLCEIVSLRQLRRVGAWRGESQNTGELIVGYMLPMGRARCRPIAFGMLWERPAYRAELVSAFVHVRRRRLWDSSCGRVDDTEDEPAACSA